MNLANKLQEKVVEFCKNLSHRELQDLVIYLGNEIEANKKPTEIQQQFCETFLGAVYYAEFLQYWALPENKRPLFGNIKIISYNLNELYTFVSWQSNLRISNLLVEIADEKVNSSKLKLKLADKKVEKARLREDIAKAIVNSYEGDIFYKDNGWCNVIDVLSKYKLVNLEDYE